MAAPEGPEGKKHARKGKSDPIEAEYRHVVPKTEHGSVDKEKVREMFDASEFVEWTPFARSLGWDPIGTRNDFPVNLWITEKKKRLALESTEELSNILWFHRDRWQREVMKTLRDYPESAEFLHGLIRKKAAFLKQKMDQDLESVKTAELAQLATALNICREAHQRSLLIQDWDVKVAEEQVAHGNEASGVHERTGYKITIKGFGEVTPRDIEDLKLRYHDPEPETPLQESAPLNP